MGERENVLLHLLQIARADLNSDGLLVLPSSSVWLLTSPLQTKPSTWDRDPEAEGGEGERTMPIVSYSIFGGATLRLGMGALPDVKGISCRGKDATVAELVRASSSWLKVWW